MKKTFMAVATSIVLSGTTVYADNILTKADEKKLFVTTNVKYVELNKEEKESTQGESWFHRGHWQHVHIGHLQPAHWLCGRMQPMR